MQESYRTGVFIESIEENRAYADLPGWGIEQHSFDLDDIEDPDLREMVREGEQWLIAKYNPHDGFLSDFELAPPPIDLSEFI